MARLLYHIANTGTEAPHAFSARILARLKNIPAKVAPTIGIQVMDFEDILPVLLDDYAVNPAICASLNGILMKSTMQRSFAKCGF
jgi:hypothetical protein